MRQWARAQSGRPGRSSTTAIASRWARCFAGHSVLRWPGPGCRACSCRGAKRGPAPSSVQLLPNMRRSPFVACCLRTAHWRSKLSLAGFVTSAPPRLWLATGRRRPMCARRSERWTSSPRSAPPSSGRWACWGAAELSLVGPARRPGSAALRASWLKAEGELGDTCRWVRAVCAAPPLPAAAGQLRAQPAGVAAGAAGGRGARHCQAGARAERVVREGGRAARRAGGLPHAAGVAGSLAHEYQERVVGARGWCRLGPDVSCWPAAQVVRHGTTKVWQLLWLRKAKCQWLEDKRSRQGLAEAGFSTLAEKDWV